ncbi:glycoside hydrolase family 61 protein, partial [Vararia minispora EC-137]
ALAPLAAAHGFLGKIVIDGKTYAGNEPGTGKGTPSAIQRVDTIDPLKGVDNVNLPCGSHAQPAALHADAAPGSNLSVFWTDAGGQNWPHRVGPVMTYMAACTGAADCASFNASNAQWFKIDQLGLQDAQSGLWWHNEFMQGRSLSMSIPENIAPGNYLLRSEIIALHLMPEPNGVEFYPACAQLSIAAPNTTTSSTTFASLTPNATVSFPGAYAANDAGIFAPGVFDTPVTYTFPGGTVSNVRSASDSAGTRDLDAKTTKAASGTQVPASLTASGVQAPANTTASTGASANGTATSAGAQPST